MTPEQRRALRDHALATRISGHTLTSRDNAVSNAEKLAAGDPDKALGIGARGRDAQAVMDAVAALCGCSPSLSDREGAGVIEVEATLDGLAAMGDRVARAARAGERILIVTGHPTGLLAMYQGVSRAFADAGAKVLTALEDEYLVDPSPGASGRARRPKRIRYLDSVGVLSDAANLLHTHESWPMDALLDGLEPPDLVLADHGWAGAAIARGIDTVCFTDVNDPALAVAKADGLADVVVPLDDNLAPSVYDPFRDYLVGRIRG